MGWWNGVKNWLTFSGISRLPAGGRCWNVSQFSICSLCFCGLLAFVLGIGPRDFSSPLPVKGNAMWAMCVILQHDMSYHGN